MVHSNPHYEMILSQSYSDTTELLTCGFRMGRELCGNGIIGINSYIALLSTIHKWQEEIQYV